jgi:hypothetical protein
VTQKYVTGKEFIKMLLIVGMLVFAATYSYHRGYNKASEEVAMISQALLMENCLSFNASLEQHGKPERMDCSLFSDITPSASPG